MGNSGETRVYIDGGATPESLGLTLPTEIDDKELGLHVDLKTAIWPSPSIKAGGLKGWKMPERKTKMLIFGAEMDVVDVPFEPTIEHLNQYKLEDGSVVNVKAVVMSFIRIEGQFTAEGAPVYIPIVSPAVRVVSSVLASPKVDVEEIQ
jgi:hypothetical protein